MIMNGLLIIDKPEGMTSHDVVDRIRKQFSTTRVGHLGTLDPMATGVLPVCLGKATRLGQYMQASPKEYIGEIRFGLSTTTYDREGSPTSEERTLRASEDEVKEGMRRLTGLLDQVPPPFSAKKIGGVPAYRLARRGKFVETTPGRVEIFQFEMTAFEPPTVWFRVLCSPGTYVRSLAHDLGTAIGCGAHLSALRRTRSGDFVATEAVPLERATPGDITPMEKLLNAWPRVEVSEADEQKVRHGGPIQCDAHGKLVRIFNKRGEFLAIATLENGWGRPKLVLTSNPSD
jgi:tRNA pseudouridine55 synthase